MYSEFMSPKLNSFLSSRIVFNTCEGWTVTRAKETLLAKNISKKYIV